MTTPLTSLTTTSLALRLVAFAETTAYVVLLVAPGTAPSVLAELEDELKVFSEDMTVGVIPSSLDAEQLARSISSNPSNVLLVNAEGIEGSVWSELDRRRSELARHGATVLLSTPESFDALMRVAPNIASWLGGNVFSHEELAVQAMQQREQRLVALRAWSGKTDDEVRREAEEGNLPRDPEYAEWLVLLGRGDLLNA